MSTVNQRIKEILVASGMKQREIAIKAENTALKGEIKKLNSRLVDKDDVIQNLVAILKNKMQ